jgi:hypothetical protein
MSDSILHNLLGVGLLALYLWAPVPQGYRRWAFLLLFLLFPLVAGTPLRDVRLALHGVPAVGTALTAHCSGGKSPQMMLTYRYTADGVTMTASGPAGEGNGGCEMRAGDLVYLSYLPKEPMVSSAVRHPARAFLLQLLGWMALCLFLTWMKTEQAARFKERLDTTAFRRP